MPDQYTRTRAQLGTPALDVLRRAHVAVFGIGGVGGDDGGGAPRGLFALAQACQQQGVGAAHGAGHGEAFTGGEFGEVHALKGEVAAPQPSLARVAPEPDAAGSADFRMPP